jgi:LPS-assembly protein
VLQRLIILFIILTTLQLPLLAAAQTTAKIQDILIDADSMFRDSVKDTAELEGNIQIVYQGQHIRADKARVHMRAKQIELSGNVEIMDAKNTIRGERVYLDYENNTGVIHNGMVQSGQVMFSGTTLQKIGPEEFIVSEADYTACTNCPASWSFSGTTVRAEMGGYAYIKNGILRFWDFPVFWFPYLVVPLKSDRQSGVLTPGFENSNTGGFSVAVPYFWAINRNTDATITMKNYEKRGLKTDVEYRYLLNDTSDGTLNFASLYDNAFADEARLNNYRPAEEKGSPINRWYARYQHYLDMPDDFVHRAQINLASDLQYSKDFPLETLNHGDSAMENRMSITKNTKDQHFSVDSSYYVNFLHADPLNGNADAVHRLPELRFAQTQKNLGDSNFIYSMDLNYVNFTRSGNAYDDLAPFPYGAGSTSKYVKNTCNKPDWENDPACRRVYDGNYDPSVDIIRTGQRIDFLPTVYYPIKIGDGIDLIPRLAYRETHYTFTVGDETNYVRRYLRTEVAGRMSFSRIFGDTINPKSTRYKHEFNPEINYTHIPWMQAANHPFFGTGQIDDSPYSSRDSISDGDLGSPYGLQFDYNDRIYDRNLVTFAIVNKIVEKRWIGDRPDYRQIAALKIAQSYDATQANRTNKEPWSDIVTTLDVRMDHFQTYTILNYFPIENLTNTSSRVRVMNDNGQFGQLALTQQYKITPGVPVDTSSRTEDYTVSAGFVSPYLNLMGQMVYDANWTESESKEKIKSWAYIAQFKPPGNCWLISVTQNQITGGDSSIALNFEFTFDGNPKAPLPPEALDKFLF